ncbi:NFACT family protein [Candidatus Woesearchaeota archaeon]|nr:NFACT family protein [Candidatus Woesearchaeota archaeon]
MKQELTSLDLYYLVKELQDLVGARVDKFYEQSEDKKEFLFVFHKTGPGKMMLRIKLPSLAYITDFKQTFPDTPPGFCMFLRKHLGSGRIKEVRQKGFDRILEIVFDTKEGSRILICELFSKGNMVLVDEDYKIKGLLESQNWEARTVRGGTKYEYPPAQLVTQSINEEQFKKIISETKMDLAVKSFAVDLGLGGLYAEELCKRAAISNDKKKLDDKEIKKVYVEIKKLFEEKIKANKFGDDIVPFELLLSEGTEKDYYESFSKSLDDHLSIKAAGAAEEKAIREKQGRQDKVSVVIEKQEQRLKELEQSIVDNQRKGELIYEHYQEIKELLDNINLDRKKMSWEELKKKYAGNKLIKEINEKEGKVVVEL